jgi:hypothetical protein
VRFLLVVGLVIVGAQPAWGDTAPQPKSNNWLADALELVRPAPVRPHPAVVRVIAPEREGMSLGSGTLVDVNDQYGLVVTNWHVVRDATGEITVVFPDGFRSGGRVLKTDRDWDLAAVSVWKPRVAPVPLATVAPRPGDLLTIAGYGSGLYRAATGRCTQYVSPGNHLPYEMVEVSAAARQGDSGGPIFNSQGQLAGVLFGEGHGLTSGSYCFRVHRFLSSVITPTAQPIDLQLARAAPVTTPVGPPVTQQSPAVVPLAPINHPASTSPAPPPATTFTLNRGNPEPPPVDNWLASAPAVEVSSRPSPQQRSDEEPIVWQDFAGRSPLEQVKTALAIVGCFALLLHGARWLRTG